MAASINLTAFAKPIAKEWTPFRSKGAVKEDRTDFIDLNGL
jgi:hypothetical protein